MSKDEKSKVTLKKKVGQEEAIVILENILNSFKSGNMLIQNGDETVPLIPSDEINEEIKAKTKKLKNKLSMEFSWKATPVEVEVENFSVTEAGDNEKSAPDETAAEDQESKPEPGKARIIKKAAQ